MVQCHRPLVFLPLALFGAVTVLRYVGAMSSTDEHLLDTTRESAESVGQAAVQPVAAVALVSPKHSSEHSSPQPMSSLGRRSPGRRGHTLVEWMLRKLTVEEKISLMSTDSPVINRTTSRGRRLLIPAFNWWAECLHGAVVTDGAQRGATIFLQPIALAATFDRRLAGAVGAAIGKELRALSNEAERQGRGPSMTNCFAPNINLYRDPRWGRGSETFGEDPTLTGDMAVAFVRGMQGGHPRYLQAGATCKHYAAYSLEEWGGVSRHEFDARLDPRDVRDSYLPAFEACVAGAQPHSVMCSYNAINGTPACANSWLLRDQLRGRMRFDGLVVSDCGAVEDISDAHGWRATRAEGAAAALKAGTDLACADYSYLSDALRDGLVANADIDAAVRRLLLARYSLGHFDGPRNDNPFRSIPARVVSSREHLTLAREAAARSIVLLKNTPPGAGLRNEESTANGAAGSGGMSGCQGVAGVSRPLLPLQLGCLRKLTVVGPFANRSEYMLGSYYGAPAGEVVTPLQAIQRRVAGRAAVELVTGAEVMGQGADTLGVSHACQNSDVCIFFVGTSAVSTSVREARQYGTLPVFSPIVEAEGWDRPRLTLPGRQLSLIQAVARRTNTPIVVVLVHGGPLDVEWLQQSPRVGAILTAWTPGQGGAAIADVLFGHVSPSGRLPVTFYFNNYTSQSEFTDMSMRRWPGRTHRFLQVPVLYPFGHGLSYTSFEYSPPTISAAAGSGSTMQHYVEQHSSSCDRQSHYIRVSVNVTNTGGMAAGEVVLLLLSFVAPPQHQHWLGRPLAGRRLDHPSTSLLHARCAPVAGSDREIPRQVLAGFERVHVSPGHTAQLHFDLGRRDWLPFSPVRDEGNTECVPPPYCGTYSFCAGGRCLNVTLAEDAAQVKTPYCE